MYANLAEALAERGIGLLRIDFRGFGKSDGDTGASTIVGQVEDAEAAHQYLTGLDWVDPSRVGVIGFSLGGGVSTIAAGTHPDWFKSMVTWSSVGDMVPDMTGSVGQEAFDTAAEKGIVGLDLGWRTIALKKEFFDSLGQYDLAQLIQQFPGSYLAVAGDQDFSAAYAPGFVESASGAPKEVWIIPGGDHIYGVLSGDATMSNDVIERTAEWFHALVKTRWRRLCHPTLEVCEHARYARTEANVVDRAGRPTQRGPGRGRDRLGGSYAAGTQHAASDLDVGLYYFEDAPFALDTIREIAAVFRRKGSPPSPVSTNGALGSTVAPGSTLHRARSIFCTATSIMSSARLPKPSKGSSIMTTTSSQRTAFTASSTWPRPRSVCRSMTRTC